MTNGVEGNESHHFPLFHCRVYTAVNCIIYNVYHGGGKAVSICKTILREI